MANSRTLADIVKERDDLFEKVSGLSAVLNQDFSDRSLILTELNANDNVNFSLAKEQPEQTIFVYGGFIKDILHTDFSSSLDSIFELLGYYLKAWQQDGLEIKMWFKKVSE